METNKKKSASWGVIILLLLFVPFIGIILLVKKLFEDKAGAYKNSLVARMIGVLQLFFGAFLFFTVVYKEPEVSDLVVLFLFFIGPGLFLFLKGLSLKKAGVRYEIYLELIWQRRIYSIDEIALEVSLTHAKTLKELQALINTGYIENAYVDQGRQMVIVEGYEPNATKQPVVNKMKQKTKQKKIKVVVCNNCGASNAVTLGISSQCEYCRTPLSFT